MKRKSDGWLESTRSYYVVVVIVVVVAVVVCQGSVRGARGKCKWTLSALSDATIIRILKKKLQPTIGKVCTV